MKENAWILIYSVKLRNKIVTFFSDDPQMTMLQWHARGSRATMYYTTMYKNGKMYNLEVLYDEVTDTVYHFEYARKAMGNLPAIQK